MVLLEFRVWGQARQDFDFSGFRGSGSRGFKARLLGVSRFKVEGL